MNKRERILAIAVASLVLGWVLLIWVIDPLITAFDDIDNQTETLRNDVETAQNLIDNEKKLRQKWVGYERAGLTRTLEQADGQMRIVLLDWAAESGIKVGDPALSSRSQREDDDERFVRVARTLNATGSIEEVQAMLWSVRTSPFPLRVEKCIVEKRRDEGDTLDLVLTVSTLIMKHDAEGKPVTPLASTRGAWVPEEEDASAFRDIVDYNIFRADRSAIARRADERRNPTEPEASTPRETVPVTDDQPSDPDAQWLLVGISHGPDGAVVFFEQTETNELLRLEEPAPISQGELTQIGYDAVVYAVQGEERIINVGQSLAGTRTVPTAAVPSSDSTSGDAAAPKPGSLEDRLRQLREQRAREQGLVPAEQSVPSGATPSDEDESTNDASESTAEAAGLDAPAND